MRMTVRRVSSFVAHVAPVAAAALFGLAVSLPVGAVDLTAPKQTERRPLGQSIDRPLAATSDPQPVPPSIANATPRPERYANFSAAVAFGTVVEITDWLSRGRSIEGDGSEAPAIVTATRHRRYDVVEFLLQQGARVEHADGQNRTAMFYAKMDADSRMIEILAKAGAKNPFVQ
jgi:hypothetical protein